MLPRRTHVWQCKVNEESSYYEHSNVSNEVNAYLIVMIRFPFFGKAEFM